MDDKNILELHVEQQDTDDGHCHVQKKNHSRSTASANFGNVSCKT